MVVAFPNGAASRRGRRGHDVREQEGSAHGNRFAADGARNPQALHHTGRPPVRRGRLGATRCADNQLPRRGRGLRAARCRGALLVERQRHEHPLSEVLPWDSRHSREGVVAQAGCRPGGGHDRRVGDERRLLRGRHREGDLLCGAEAPHHPSEGRVQLAGVVQHRGEGSPSARICLLHPRCRGLDGLDLELVHRRRA